MKQQQTYYTTLGVSRRASLEKIKQAYRRLARQYHPDMNPGDRDALERFQEINQAYQTLSDPAARERYDAQVFSDDARSSPPPPSSESFTELYQQGLRHAQRGRYREAIAQYSQALELNPNLADIYNQRGFAYYKLKQYSAAFADYTQSLEIDSASATGYYYRGLTRFKLGYSQAAIEDYTRAIELDGTHAQAYYHRGLAHADLREKNAATSDLQEAIRLFTAAGDRVGAREADAVYRKLSPSLSLRSSLTQGVTTLQRIGMTISRYAFNPMGGLLPAFARLTRGEAIATSLTLAVIFDGCFVLGMQHLWQTYDDLGTAPILQFMGLGATPFLLLAAASFVVGLVLKRPATLATTLFFAGAPLLPMSAIALAAGFLPIWGAAVCSLIAGCYVILTLYSGCNQLLNVSEEQSALLVPILVLLSLSPFALIGS